MDEKEMQKLATIYRNSELNYVYVCYLCECSFTNIVDTLNHVETHFDDKVNIALDKNYEFVDVSQAVSETVDGNPIKSECEVDVSDVVSETLDENRVDSGKVLECKVEQKFTYHQHFEELTSKELTTKELTTNELTSKELTSKDFVGKCKLCSETFDTATLLIFHTINEHISKPCFTCPQCSQIWENKFTFFTHLQKHINENVTTYDILIDKLLADCKEIVSSRTAKRPRTKYQKKCQMTCDICQKSFSSTKEIGRHMRAQHILKRTFDCDKCERKITGKVALHAHYYGHLTHGDAVNDLDENVLHENLRQFLDDNIYCDDSTTDKKFGCKLCSLLTLTMRKSAELHIKQRHIHYVRNNLNRKFQCPYCHISFSHASTLDVHKQIHEQEHKFFCSICNKSFAQLRYLRTHEVTHSDVKSHQCTECGSTFNTLVRLNYHMRTHSNVTSKCSICNKEVKAHRLNRHVLNVHRNSHRPYSCSHCSQTFKTTSTLKNHSYRHSGIKNFECRFQCKESFISSAGRRAHERSKHETQK